MAKKQKTGTDVVAWDKQLADLAKDSSAGLKTSEGKFISFKSGQLTVAGADVPDNELDCVIIGWTNAFAYYDPDVRYDPKNPQSPICYAFGQDEDEMQPHDESPNKQHDACASCPLNEFGSADGGEGKGKACKNTYRLALISANDLDNIEGAEIYYASIPPKSLKNWANYVKKELAKMQRPHWSVVTKLGLIGDDESQFKVTFKHESDIDDGDQLAALKEKWEAQKGEIGFAYPEREPPAKPAKKAGTNKFSKK